jgi:DNA polymerase family A
MAAEIWVGDFEFYQPEGELPIPLCFAAQELHSGRWVRLPQGEFPADPPYSNDSTLIAFAADAELTCCHVLGWPFPQNVIDLHAEYLNYTNYLERTGKNESSLISVLTEFGIDHIDTEEKQRMRTIAIAGGPRTPEEKAALLQYCETDVIPLAKLYSLLIGSGNIDQAIARGRYMKAVTMMQVIGTPIDVAKLQEFRGKWDAIKEALVSEIDQEFNVYVGTKFSHGRFENYIERRGLPWPKTKPGLLKTDKETFKSQILSHPELAPLHELKSTLSLMRRESISVGSDARNRTALHPFRSKTSRNQPGSSRYIFGAPSWMRSFVKPAPGNALAYIDYEQQEFGIAASLSGDKAMQAAYRSGDPYLAFAKLAKALPKDGTSKTHPVIRDLFKQVCLGIQYSMQKKGLAERIGRSIEEAEILLAHHKNQFPDFWHWVDRVLTHMEFCGSLCTPSGWRVFRKYREFPARWRRSAQNWLIQSTGADLLRLVCSMATEAQIRVCGPVHDALLVEDSMDRIEQTVAETKEIMKQASMIVLDGFEIRTEDKIFSDRFIDKRGVAMWTRVNELMATVPAPITTANQGALFEKEHTDAAME